MAVKGCCCVLDVHSRITYQLSKIIYYLCKCLVKTFSQSMNYEFISLLVYTYVYMYIYKMYLSYSKWSHLTPVNDLRALYSTACYHRVTSLSFHGGLNLHCVFLSCSNVAALEQQVAVAFGSSSTICCRQMSSHLPQYGHPKDGRKPSLPSNKSDIL